MSINLPLKEMTLKEKLAVMELIWEDLVRTPDVVESPAWHRAVLEERGQRIAEGKSQFTDWEKAKLDIRNKLS
ncbi:MAG TPA: addiction module protein [Nitrospirales bacterium]|nr:addiction module protein [Nitrospirales bacterium]